LVAYLDVRALELGQQVPVVGKNGHVEPETVKSDL
jgi:hypothetical protein